MPETPFLYYTLGEISNFLGARKRSIDNANITIDRAEVSSMGLLLLLLLLSRNPFLLCFVFEARDKGYREKD